ncbi:SRPBCC family protein [Mucilaginibacter aquatilis]|uniref:Cell division protein n=1 Tax=Mucilaginibacter aquatilis TaxID=1517760 RepID=A0A6I4IFK7_9SPHI|nr:SRPBCC family protein [Mucilaginibacter aquatilis]MVN92326.1 cell division protein [Mucilaginibacter aquatilis]
MAVIKLQTFIEAPVANCFNLARSIDVHVESMHSHREKAIAGITKGLIHLNEAVTWKAMHFCLPFKMTVKIIELNDPGYFVDAMTVGPFKYMRHYHAFWPQPHGTLMEDEFVFRSPLGHLGNMIDKWLLKPYLTKLLQRRNLYIKQAAENALNNRTIPFTCSR